MSVLSQVSAVGRCPLMEVPLYMYVYFKPILFLRILNANIVITVVMNCIVFV